MASRVPMLPTRVISTCTQLSPLAGALGEVRPVDGSGLHFICTRGVFTDFHVRQAALGTGANEGRLTSLPGGRLTSLVPVASGYMFDWDLLLHVTFVPLTCLPVKGGMLKRF